jgi:DNA-binding cell septation regulator SpoVG
VFDGLILMSQPGARRGEDDTVSVTATVLRVKRAEVGRLLALAEVEIEIAGVAFVLHGVRVVKTGPRSRGIAAPCFRLAGGRLADAIHVTFRAVGRHRERGARRIRSSKRTGKINGYRGE